MQTIKILVLGASRFDFTNDRDQRIQGTKIHYIEVDNTSNTSENVKGSLPATATLPYHAFETIKNSPGYYDMQIGFELRRGKPTAVVEEIKYISEAKIS